MWPDRRLMDLFKIEHPIVLAPMAGAMDCRAGDRSVRGAAGSARCRAPCSPSSRCASRSRKSAAAPTKPVNLNFFCHTPPVPNNAREDALARPAQALLPRAWHRSGGAGAVEQPHAVRRGALRRGRGVEAAGRRAFISACRSAALLKRVKAAGCVVLSSATTVEEARWLEERGVDAMIAQGDEAGGHRGMFLTDDLATQVGTFALVPQVVDAVKVPVIAAGAHHRRARHRGGASRSARPACRSAPPICTARKSKISAPHRAALKSAGDDGTGAHQSDDRPAGARHRQPRDARARADQSDGAGVPARRRRARAAARQGRSGGLGRFLADVVRPGGGARPRHAGAAN